jgi:16S rRNA (guanine(1405)-N(7))-methyltransferase
MEKEELLEKIKLSKKYKTLSREIIEDRINEYINKNPNFKRYPEKIIIKEIKALLHKSHGSFQINTKKRNYYLSELKKNPENLEIVNLILNTNASTKDRISAYPVIYSKIFEITGKPNSILDLGCGLNPISILYAKLDNLKEILYYAYDINDEDSNLINEFFKIQGIKGKSKILNLNDLENIKKIENAEVCFMFKFLDVVEKNRGHKYSEEIIKVLAEKCKFIVVSFSTRTITGKPMNFPHRGWIERMLERINIKFEKLDFSEDAGEIFYVISK